MPLFGGGKSRPVRGVKTGKQAAREANQAHRREAFRLAKAGKISRGEYERRVRGR